MASNRRPVLVEGMFLDCATPDEVRTFNELLEQNRKGSAIVYALKRIRDRWVELHNGKKAPNYAADPPKGTPIYAVNNLRIGEDTDIPYLKKITLS